jgi:hypothetical protein
MACCSPSVGVWLHQMWTLRRRSASPSLPKIAAPSSASSASSSFDSNPRSASFDSKLRSIQPSAEASTAAFGKPKASYSSGSVASEPLPTRRSTTSGRWRKQSRTASLS